MPFYYPIRRFLERLSHIDGKDWVIYQSGFIRSERGECPICAVANQLLGETLYYSAAYEAYARIESLLPPEERLTPADLRNIMIAADDWVGDEDHDRLRDAFRDSLHVKPPAVSQNFPT